MKRRVNKKAVITLLCTTTLIGVITAGYSLSPLKFEKKLVKAGLKVSSNAIYGGYNDEGRMKKFSLVDVGNYETETYENAYGLLQDISKPTGVIIRTNAKDYCEIYKEFDYTKKLVKQFNIDYPICLDITNMFYSKSLKEEDVNSLVNAYIDKAKANGLNVFVVGDNNAMNTLVAVNGQNEDIYEDYPIGLIWNNKKEKITLNYDLVISDNYIYSNKRYYDKLNTCDEFIDDFVYTTNSDTSFLALGEEMGMSGEQIRRYNNISAYDNLDNRKIIIPNKYHKPYILGVDISSYQEEIDFKIMKEAGVQFAIQRAAYTYDNEDGEKEYLVDTYFNHYSIELSKHGIMQGAYYYSTAKNRKEMDEEVDLLLRTVEGHAISLPLYIDIEGETLRRLDDDATRGVELDLIDYFCSRIKKAGYTPGIYINENYNKYLDSIATKASIWNCGGYYYNVEQSLDDMYLTQSIGNGINVYQNTKKGNGEELGVGSQYVCLDYAESEFIKSKKMN